MSEAVEPATSFAFDMVKFDKLVFSSALGNHRSRRIEEKSGAKFLHIERARFVDPQYTEREVWELYPSWYRDQV